MVSSIYFFEIFFELPGLKFSKLVKFYQEISFKLFLLIFLVFQTFSVHFLLFLQYSIAYTLARPAFV